MEVARTVEVSGWGASLVRSEEVLGERFWELNVRRLNGQRIRQGAGVPARRKEPLVYSNTKYQNLLIV